MNIEWKEISPDYVVSSDGVVMSRKLGGLRALKPGHNSRGYPFVQIYVGGAKRIRPIHQLVAEAFLGPRPTPAHEVNHKDGVRSNNRDHNLEWVTKSEQQRHRFDILKHGALRGEACSWAKVTEAGVREMRQRCAAGESQRAIAADYGIHPATLNNIVQRQTWAWVV